MTGDQLLDHAAEPARIDGGGIELPKGVRPVRKTDQDHRQVGVVRVATLAIGQPIEQRRQLGDDLGVEIGEAPAQLRSAQRCDADLGEQHAAHAIGGQLDEEEVETASERPFGIEDVELGAQRGPEILDDLIDGGDQEVFLRLEVVVHEPRRKPGFLRDALHRRLGEAVLEDRGAQTVDDLAAARSGETPASHKIDWLANQSIIVKTDSDERPGTARLSACGPLC